MFTGFVALAATKRVYHQARNTSKVPIQADALPTFRVYGASGLIGSGTLSQSLSGSITGATNASPIVISSANHNLTDGTRVTVASVGGNTAANGTWTVESAAASTFALSGSTGNGAYTAGGTWVVTGLYHLEIVASAGNGYAAGQTYTVVVTSVIGGTTYTDVYTFTVT